MDEMLTVDLRRCLACKTCEVACAIAHSRSKDLVACLQETPGPATRIHVIGVDGTPVPLQCQHCEDAPCIAVCPSGALAKDEEGAVVMDLEKCIGCKACLLVCPFGSIALSREGRPLKCDLCLERREAGEEPACLVACPTGAIRLLPAAELVSQKRREAAARALAAADKEDRQKE